MKNRIVTTVVFLLMLVAVTFVSYQGGCVIEGMITTQAQIISNQMYLGQVTYQADQLLIKNMGNLEFYLDDKIDAQSKDIVDLDLCLNGKLDHIVEANKMVDSTQTERIQRLYYAKDLINKEIAELSRLGRDDIDLEVVARVHTQVVRIQSGGGQGSGVILDNGRILTCAHIFQNGTEGKIELTDGRVFDFTEDQLTMHVDLDLSIIDLGIDLNIEKVELRYKQLILGEEVMVAGNPKGGGTFGFNTVTFGRITGMNRHIDPISSGGLWQGQELIQTDAPIEGGNSGGPIFDRDGKLIGIVVAKFPYTDGLGFAVPVEYILELYGRL